MGTQDNEIFKWKIKKMINYLQSAKGNGTSMISLLIPPGEQIAKINQMLTDEYSTATNIKSRVNRQSVLNAITSTQNRLKLYNKTPPNGLIIYCGTIMTDEGKERKVTYDFEPFKPLTNKLYLCDNKFHTEDLHAMLDDDQKFGFIIMDGHEALLGSLCGKNSEVLHSFKVDLPPKQGRGGQSKLRFERIRMEKRHNYLRKVTEFATQFFITDNKPNVTGLILGGSADFKTELSKSDLFDPRLQKIILKLVDIAYSGLNGFNQAIELASDVLSNVKFVEEKQLLSRFMLEIAKDTGLYCFGWNDTWQALQVGAVETLIVWEDLKLPMPKDLFTMFQSEKDSSMDGDNNLLIDFLTTNYKKFGTKLFLITDKTSEGSQFCKGFGGLGGLLRYKMEFIDDSIPDIESHSDEDLFI